MFGQLWGIDMNIKDAFLSAKDFLTGTTAKKLNRDFIVFFDENENIAKLYFRNDAMSVAEPDVKFNERNDEIKLKGRFASKAMPKQLFQAFEQAEKAKQEVEKMGLRNVTIKSSSDLHRGDTVIHIVYLQMPVDEHNPRNRNIAKQLVKMDKINNLYIKNDKQR